VYESDHPLLHEVICYPQLYWIEGHIQSNSNYEQNL